MHPIPSDKDWSLCPGALIRPYTFYGGMILLGLKIVREKELSKEPVPQLMILSVDCSECKTDAIKGAHLLNAESAMIVELKKHDILDNYILLVLEKDYQVNVFDR